MKRAGLFAAITNVYHFPTVSYLLSDPLEMVCHGEPGNLCTYRLCHSWPNQICVVVQDQPRKKVCMYLLSLLHRKKKVVKQQKNSFPSFHFSSPVPPPASCRRTFDTHTYTYTYSRYNTHANGSKISPEHHVNMVTIAVSSFC